MPEEYGVLAIVDSFIVIAAIIFGLGIRGAVNRYFHERTDDFNQFLGSNTIFIACWSLLCVFILYLSIPIIAQFFNINQKILYFCIIIPFFQVFFEIYQSFLQASQNSKLLSKINIVRSLFLALLTIVLVIYLKENKYYGQIIAEFVIGGCVFLFSIWSIKRIAIMSFRFKDISYSLMFGIPVCFHLLSQYILASFDQIIINQLIGPKETGIYFFAFKIGLILNIIAMAMMRSWNPIFYQKMNAKDNKGIENLAIKYSKIVYFLAFFLVVFSKEIIMIIGDEKYSHASEILPIITLSYVFFFLYMMYVQYAFYYKRTYLVALFTVIAGIINVFLNYLLIPNYGYEIAAWTTLISYMSLFILHYFNVRYIIKNLNSIRLIKIIPDFIVVIIIVLFLRLFGTCNFWFLIIFKIIIILIGYFLLFKMKNLNENK